MSVMSALATFLASLGSGLASKLPAISAIFAHGWKGAKGAFQSMSDAITGVHLTGAQRESNAFESDQAQKQMDFEERMSNTSFQRGVADMKSAGVNPALLYGNGSSGASTPSGAMAGSESPGTPDVVGFMTALANLSLLKAQRDNIHADTQNKEQQVRESAERINQIRANTEQIVANTNVAIANLRKIGLEGDALEISNSFLSREKELALQIGSMDIKEIEANVNEINKRIEKLDTEKLAILQQIAVDVQRVNLLLAQEKLTDAQRSEVYSTIKQIDANTENLVKSGHLLQKDINWYTHDKISGDVGVLGQAVGSVASGFAKGLGNRGRTVVKGFRK